MTSRTRPDPTSDRESDSNRSADRSSTQPDSERQAYAQELRELLEKAIDALPEGYRLVFMLRVVEGLSTSETGEGLGFGDEVIKTRLHRARVMLRRTVRERLGDAAPLVFRFHAPRCDRVVRNVFSRIAFSAAASQ